VVSPLSKYCKRWNIPVSDHLDEQLEKYIDKDAYSTKSEFIRSAVREKLKEEKKIFREEQAEKEGDSQT